jgi:hypothetical protein
MPSAAAAAPAIQPFGRIVNVLIAAPEDCVRFLRSMLCQI